MKTIDVTSVQVWAGELDDRPGALASLLAQITLCARANIEFIVARPAPDHPGRSILYIAPLTTAEQQEAASAVGLRRAEQMHVLRLVGGDRPGLFAGVAGTLAQADINIHGVSAAAANGVAILYLRFATAAEAGAARELLTHVLRDEFDEPGA